MQSEVSVLTQRGRCTSSRIRDFVSPESLGGSLLNEQTSCQITSVNNKIPNVKDVFLAQFIANPIIADSNSSSSNGLFNNCLSDSIPSSTQTLFTKRTLYSQTNSTNSSPIVSLDSVDTLLRNTNADYTFSETPEVSSNVCPGFQTCSGCNECNTDLVPNELIQFVSESTERASVPIDSFPDETGTNDNERFETLYNDSFPSESAFMPTLSSNTLSTKTSNFWIPDSSSSSKVDSPLSPSATVGFSDIEQHTNKHKGDLKLPAVDQIMNFHSHPSSPVNAGQFGFTSSPASSSTTHSFDLTATSHSIPSSSFSPAEFSFSSSNHSSDLRNKALPTSSTSLLPPTLSSFPVFSTAELGASKLLNSLAALSQSTPKTEPIPGQKKLGGTSIGHEVVQPSLIATSNSVFQTQSTWQNYTPITSKSSKNTNSALFPITTCVHDLRICSTPIIVTACQPTKSVPSTVKMSPLRATTNGGCSQTGRFILPHASVETVSMSSFTPRPDKLLSSSSAPPQLQLICKPEQPTETVSKPVIYFNTPPLNTSTGNTSLFLLPHSATLALAAAATVQQNLTRPQLPLTTTVTDAASSFLTPKMTTQILLIQTSSSSCLQKTLNIISLASQQQQQQQPNTMMKTSPTIFLPSPQVSGPTLPPFTSLSTFCGASEEAKQDQVIPTLVVEKKEQSPASPSRYRNAKLPLTTAVTTCENAGRSGVGWSESAGLPRRRHQCPYCTKSCERKDNLQAHIRTHTGERPYPCRFCPKAFPQKDHLRAHIRTHTGEKPYRCPQCAKAFAQLGNLHRHVKTHRR